MRAVHYVDGRVVVQDCPEPTGDGVRVHVRAVGICGSDLHMHAMGSPIPVIPGHEIGGVLDDGTPVSVEPLQPCGRCRQLLYEHGGPDLLVDGPRDAEGLHTTLTMAQVLPWAFGPEHLTD